MATPTSTTIDDVVGDIAAAINTTCRYIRDTDGTDADAWRARERLEETLTDLECAALERSPETMPEHVETAKAAVGGMLDRMASGLRRIEELSEPDPRDPTGRSCIATVLEMYHGIPAHRAQKALQQALEALRRDRDHRSAGRDGRATPGRSPRR